MYRYGEDFCNIEEVGGLLDHFRQKRQEQAFIQTDGGNNGASGQEEKNTENIDNLFDR